MKTGVSRFPVGKFWSHSAEKFGGHPFNVSENLGYRKILCINTIFRRKFFVSQCRKLSWASVQCFRKFRVSKNFMLNRGYHIFPSKFFCLTVPKNFMGISSMSQKKVGIENFYAYSGLSRFSVEIFWSHSAEIFRGHSFNVSENSGRRKLFCILGGITFFRRKVLVTQCRKLSSKNPTVFEKEIGLKKFYGWKGGYHVSPSNYFGLTVPKKFVGIPSMFQKFWGIEKFYA